METIIDTNQQNMNASPFKTALKWGIIGALLGIVQSWADFIMNDSKISQEGGWIKMLISTAVAIFTIVMCIKEHRDKNNEGFIYFGKAFKVGFGASLIAVTLMTVFIYIYYTFIIDFDLMMSKGMSKSIEKMRQSGMSEPEISKGLEVSKKFMTVGFSTGMVFVFGLIFDTIITLICAAILKKDPPQYA